jgi:hypothetical protein
VALRSWLQVVNRSRPPEAVDRIQRTNPNGPLHLGAYGLSVGKNALLSFVIVVVTVGRLEARARGDVQVRRSSPAWTIGEEEEGPSIGGDRRLSLSEDAVDHYTKVRRLRPSVENALSRRHPEIEETE